MNFEQTADEGDCQAKVNEIFERLPNLISDSTEFLTAEEIGEASYIMKLWADFCILKGFAVPEGAPEVPQKASLPDKMILEAAQDVIWALQERAGRLEEATKPKLPDQLVAETDAVHGLAFDVANGCGFQMLSGGGGK